MLIGRSFKSSPLIRSRIQDQMTSQTWTCACRQWSVGSHMLDIDVWRSYTEPVISSQSTYCNILGTNAVSGIVSQYGLFRMNTCTIWCSSTSQRRYIPQGRLTVHCLGVKTVSKLTSLSVVRSGISPHVWRYHIGRQWDVRCGIAGTSAVIFKLGSESISTQVGIVRIKLS